MRHVAGAVVVLVLALGGCGDDTQEPLDNGAINNGTNNGANNGEPTCFEGTPTTHAELLNACTDAVGIEKNPSLPLLGTDGTLPPLP